LSVSLTDQFIQERKYLLAVTPKTVIWYGCGFKAFEGALDSKETVNRRIVELSERGVKPITINSYLRTVNAYFMWLHKEHGQDLIRIPQLKEEQKILATFNLEQIHRLIHWKPIGGNQARAHIIALVALDTGLRISDLLGLARKDVDLDNLVLLVHGKGNKQRLVPVSVELRKVLYRHLAKHQNAKVFCTRNGTPLSVRNSERDFKVVCRKAGITGVRTSWHTLRHSFAVDYLRAGGNLYYLQRILGHSSITTTERYLRSLGIEDLQRVHDGLSLLSTR
jgi:site-specific recombinase XerD